MARRAVVESRLSVQRAEDLLNSFHWKVAGARSGRPPATLQWVFILESEGGDFLKGKSYEYNNRQRSKRKLQKP